MKKVSVFKIPQFKSFSISHRNESQACYLKIEICVVINVLPEKNQFSDTIKSCILIDFLVW